jgi:hypothetical protein
MKRISGEKSAEIDGSEFVIVSFDAERSGSEANEATAVSLPVFTVIISCLGMNLISHFTF